jgi:hypothetical protein
LIQWGTILCSWTGLDIYVWRFHGGSRLNEIFHQTKGSKYLNIQLAVYIDEILSFFLEFCCFFSTIKYLYLFRFNSRLSQCAKTLQYAQKDLLYFAWKLFIVFLSFISLFYSKLSSTSDIYHIAEILLLTVNTQDFYQADTLHLHYFVVFICCTMIISIINDAFRYIRSKKKSTSNEDIILFVFMI